MVISKKQKNRLNGLVSCFLVDYDNIDADDI